MTIDVIVGIVNILLCLFIIWKTWRQKPAAMFLALIGGVCYIFLEMYWLWEAFHGRASYYPDWFGAAWSTQHTCWILAVTILVTPSGQRSGVYRAIK